MKLFSFLLGSAVSTGVMLLAAPIATAQVVINEVHPQPVNGPDWVELYNLGTESVDLTAWTLEDQLSTPSVLTTFSATILTAGEYLVIEVGQKLNNTGDGVVLKTPQGMIQDQMSYSAATLGQSWARWPNGTGGFVLVEPSRAAFNLAPSPSPSSQPSPAPSSSPTPSSSPSPTPWLSLPPLQASEVNACPVSGEQEWLELYNPDSQPYTLTNWKVRDSADNTRNVTGIIPGQGFGVVSWSGSLLNNTGDTLTLETPTGQPLWTVELGSCQAGQSWILHQGEWVLTSQITKGSVNTPEVTAESTASSLTAQLSSSQAATSASPLMSNSSPVTDQTVLAALKDRLTQSGSASAQPWQAPLLQITRAGTSEPSGQGQLPNALFLEAQSGLPHQGRWLSVILTGVLLTAVSSYRLYVFFSHDSHAQAVS